MVKSSLTLTLPNRSLHAAIGAGVSGRYETLPYGFPCQFVVAGLIPAFCNQKETSGNQKETSGNRVATDFSVVRYYTGTLVLVLKPGLNVEKILLVCPDLGLTEQLTFFLQHLGFRVTSVSESRQARVEVGSGSPDMVVKNEDSHRLNGDEM